MLLFLPNLSSLLYSALIPISPLSLRTVLPLFFVHHTSDPALSFGLQWVYYWYLGWIAFNVIGI